MVNASYFEARKWSFRQTKEGVVVSFLIHPNEVKPELAMADLGSRFMVAFAQIGDDEKPLEGDSIGDERRTRNPEVGGSNPPPAPAKERKRFSDLPLSQQAAIRCGDRQFQQFLTCADENMAAKEVRSICRVSSRALLDDPNTDSGWRWLELEKKYQQHLTDQKYAGAVR